MIAKIMKATLGYLALEKGKGAGLWRKLANPSVDDWTTYLKRHGGFHSFGEDCYVLPETIFTDPVYTHIGNNVYIVGAWISGHDGSINMLNKAYGKKLDAVGPVVIKDDVFIGRGATILPGVTIGPRAIVGAGSVISKDVPPNSVVAGNPARIIRSLDEHVERIQQRTNGYPWRDLIAQRDGGFDPALEPELKRRRVEHFFGVA
ncbi:acyltransferase [Rubellimicrobium arenae]|uniref:acyltransferase n=1 Tax=Rubellimicrobium arenae TaxID=2817372 RepID=UPI001B315181|nr:acyltransferase [Rubellimicrobium arenae]